MQSWFFTEDAYPYLPEADTYESIRVNLPNKHYDPDKGADLYHMYLDLWCAADELGLEVMVNEHHQTATCVVPAAPSCWVFWRGKPNGRACSSSAIPSPTARSPCAWPKKWP